MHSTHNSEEIFINKNESTAAELITPELAKLIVGIRECIKDSSLQGKTGHCNIPRSELTPDQMDALEKHFDYDYVTEPIDGTPVECVRFTSKVSQYTKISFFPEVI